MEGLFLRSHFVISKRVVVGATTSLYGFNPLDQAVTVA